MSNSIMFPLLAVFFIIMGVIMLVFGLISEILMKIYFNTGENEYQKAYSIKEVFVSESNAQEE